MKFTDKQLEEFKKIYKDKYGEGLSNEDTLKYAIKLMTMMKHVYGLELE